MVETDTRRKQPVHIVTRIQSTDAQSKCAQRTHCDFSDYGGRIDNVRAVCRCFGGRFLLIETLLLHS